MTDTAAPTADCLIEIKGLYARLTQDGQSIELIDDATGATLFPEGVANEVVEALKNNGVEDEMRVVKQEEANVH